MSGSTCRCLATLCAKAAYIFNFWGGRTVTTFTFFACVVVGICGETVVAIPNKAVLDASADALGIPLIRGEPNALQPEGVDLDLLMGKIVAIKATYRNLSVKVDDVVRVLNQQLGCDGVERGGGMFSWRNDVTRVSALVVWNNREQAIMLKYLGPKRKVK